MTNPTFLSKHRIEALSDGIYAVTMTLLVMELKLPGHEHISSQSMLVQAVLDLFPKFISWLISFMVLSLFWLANQRMFSIVRHVDNRLVWLNILSLAGASLLPFSSALTGEYGSYFSQIIYSSNMIWMGLMSLLICRHIYAHPALCVKGMSKGLFHATTVRTAGLIFVAWLAIVISYFSPGSGNIAFLFVIAFVALGRRIEAKSAKLDVDQETAEQ